MLSQYILFLLIWPLSTYFLSLLFVVSLLSLTCPLGNHQVQSIYLTGKQNSRVKSTEDCWVLSGVKSRLLPFLNSMTLGLMPVNNHDHYLLSIPYVPNTALCVSWYLHNIDNNARNRDGYSAFTEDTGVGRSGKANSSGELTRGRPVVNSTHAVVTSQEKGYSVAMQGCLQTWSKSNFAEQYFKLECVTYFFKDFMC